MTDRDPTLLCTATSAAGTPCQAFKETGSDTCPAHGLGGAARIAKARQGQRKAKEVEAKGSHVRLTTPQTIQRLLDRTAARLQAGQIRPAEAVALDRLCRTALQAIELRELARLNDLEAQRQEVQQTMGRRNR